MKRIALVLSLVAVVLAGGGGAWYVFGRTGDPLAAGRAAMEKGDLRTAQMTSAGVRGTYEDECFIFDVNVNRRYTSLNRDRGATLVLFQITLKTVGQFGFNAF